MIVPAVLELYLGRHRRESDAFGQIRERIGQTAHVVLAVVEAAVLAKLADLAEVGGLACFEPVLARDGLVVGVNGAEGGLAKVFGQRIIGLSELVGAVGELAVLLKGATTLLKEVTAQLRLVLLLERVELALVTVEAVVLRLLSEVAEDLLGRVVEIALPLGVVLVVALAGGGVRLVGALGGRSGVATLLVARVLVLGLGRLRVAALFLLGRLGVRFALSLRWFGFLAGGLGRSRLVLLRSGGGLGWLFSLLLLLGSRDGCGCLLGGHGLK